MPLESQVRLAGKVIRIGIDSQHVHVQVLDGFVVPGTIEVTRDIDPCVLGSHEQPLYLGNLTNSEKCWGQGPDSGTESEIAAPCNFPGDRKSTRLNSSHVAISY